MHLLIGFTKLIGEEHWPPAGPPEDNPASPDPAHLARPPDSLIHPPQPALNQELLRLYKAIDLAG